METITNAANAAASYVGLGSSNDKELAGDQLGELVSDRQPTNTASREPVSGKLGSGTAGQPYDAGNIEGFSAGNTSSTGPGALPANSGSTFGTGNTSTTHSSIPVSSGRSFGTSNTSTAHSGATSASSGSTFGASNTPTTHSSIPVSSGSTLGTTSTPIAGNNTGTYDNSTDRGLGGLGAEAPQQGHHYVSTATSGKLGAVGLDATRRVDDGLDRNTNVTSTQGSSYGRESGTSHSYGHSHGHSHGLGGVLGSDRSSSNSSDRYLFDSSSAPGAGGRHSYHVDDFTDANIHHEGSGSIAGGLGTDAMSGKAGVDAGNTDVSGLGLGSNRGKDVERSRKPGLGGRQPSGLGSSSYGLNSGKPRESVGQKVERKAEEYAPAAGIAGAGAYGASRSGKEPLSGVRGSGVAGEPYDQGNTYDGAAASQTSRAAGLAGEPYEGRYGQDGQVPQATSALKNMSLDERNVGSSGAYDVTNAGSYTTQSNSGTGVPFPGGSGAGYSSSTGTTRDATVPRNTTSSTSGLGTSGGFTGDLEERIAGAPNVHGSAHDQCDDGHHTAHPTGAAAHVDGSHKPTYLNYKKGTFGMPAPAGDVDQ